LTKEDLAKVKMKFYEDHHFRDMKEPHRQELIDAIAGRKNFTSQYEKSYFRNTLHSNFPLTVEHEVWLDNPSTPEHDSALLFELYLYDRKRRVWLPVSHIKAVWENSKTLSREEASLWDEKNNWIETYRGDISPEQEFNRLMERVRTEQEQQKAPQEERK
jgi:hypothetical protein